MLYAMLSFLERNGAVIDVVNSLITVGGPEAPPNNVSKSHTRLIALRQCQANYYFRKFTFSPL
jgi:hypothetical protein